MVIERNSIRLIRLTEEYIELVRQKRNLQEIQMRMEYREYITPEMQQKWFTSINNINNYYFLIEINSIFIGLISATGIDWESGIVNNAGIFIWDKNYLQSPEIVQSSITLTDFSFYLGLKKIYISILKDNSRAIDFNKSLGYKLLPEQDGVYNQKYELTAADIYFNSTEKIRYQASLSGKIRVLVTPQEYSEFSKVISLKNNEYIKNISFEIIA